MNTVKYESRKITSKDDVYVDGGKRYSKSYLVGICKEIISYYKDKEDPTMNKKYYEVSRYDAIEGDKFGFAICTSLPIEQVEMLAGVLNYIYTDYYPFCNSKHTRQELIRFSTIGCDDDWDEDISSVEVTIMSKPIIYTLSDLE